MTQAETDNVEMSEKSEPVKITLVSISKSDYLFIYFFFGLDHSNI